MLALRSCAYSMYTCIYAIYAVANITIDPPTGLKFTLQLLSLVTQVNNNRSACDKHRYSRLKTLKSAIWLFRQRRT